MVRILKKDVRYNKAGRPRSSPSPLRGELVWYNETSPLRYQHVFRPISSGASPHR
ncbi:MAG: hypothetical protein LBQ66_00995 [Planctomycetaceae bacterium]|nr:hypothetical protein [Planctomycetaceae bacterium]